MALNPGDRCPQCRAGLLERTELGLECDTCSFSLEIEELVVAQKEARVATTEYKFRPATFKIRLDDPEDAEEFLRGLIVARSNNSSQFFTDLIDGVNAILEPWRAARLAQEMAGRGQ